MSKKIKKIKLPIELTQAIVNYLETRPYRETAELLIGVARFQEVVEEKPKNV